MDDVSKEILKKLLVIAKTQQKAILKLAQAVETPEQKKTRWEAERKLLKAHGDFIYGKLSEDNPYKNDPLYGGETPPAK